MKVSYSHLNKFFDGALPSPEAVARVLTFHAWEIESSEKVDDDTVLDVKVLPDKSAWALSHRGIAKDLSVILDIPLAHDPLRESVALEPVTNELSVEIKTSTCIRYTAALIRDVKIGPSPVWLQDFLRSLGQRSINNVVDITNYVMFGLGQPLHAFDAKKLSGASIVVRAAKNGETVTTLTGETYTLVLQDTLIVDGGTDMPIGIAGVKGGKYAEVDAGTTDIIIESANFDSVATRKTSQRLKLRTDASIRFENGIVPDMTAYGLRDAVTFILDIAEGTLVGYRETPDVWTPSVRTSVAVSLPKINSILGLSLSLDDVEAILKRFGYVYEMKDEGCVVTPPLERPDIVIPEDVIEEIGRMYGYEHVPSVIPAPVILTDINKRFFYAEAIRDALVGLGFSEIFTSSFRNADEVRIKNALASDKGYLRSAKGILENMKEALVKNAPNADLFGTDQIRLFELGKVFEKVGERDVLVLGVQSKQGYAAKRDDKALDEALAVLRNILGDSTQVSAPLSRGDAVAVIDFAKVIESLSNPSAYTHYEKSPDVAYKPFSQYPCITRDIAFWTPEDTNAEDAERVVRKNAGALAHRIDLFDRFEKEGKVSYGFRIVFQSYEKTLDGAEADSMMQAVSNAVGAQGFEVR